MKSFDVAVVGGGTAGTAAALKAQEMGCNVAILERGQELGGTCGIRLSGGAFHLAMGPMDLEPEAMFAHVKKVTNGDIPDDKAWMIAKNSKASIEWFATQGINFKPQGGPHGKFTIDPRGPSHAGRGFDRNAAPDITMRRLHTRFIEKGGTIYYGARATSLKAGENGTWMATATSSEPAGVTVQARSAIIADGGFQANPELLNRYLGPYASNSGLRALETGTGDGLSMVLAVGGYVAGEDKGVYGHILHRNATSDERFMPYPMFDGLCTIAPMVNEHGELYEHGTHDGPELTYRLLAGPNPSAYSVILDEELWTGPAANMGPYHASVNPAIEERGGRVNKGATIAALAQAAGMDSIKLAYSIERHNAAGKRQIVKAPFYCIPVTAGVTFTFPGIAVSDKMEVLRKTGGSFPGLHAAGCAAGGIHGKRGGGGYLGGLGIALITGVVAAQAAAERTRA